MAAEDSSHHKVKIARPTSRKDHDLTVPPIAWDKETRDAQRQGKTVSGLPLYELIPLDDLRLVWKGYWPNNDPRKPEGRIAYVKERLQYTRLCEQSQRLHDGATQVESSGLTPITRQWPHDSAIEVLREAMDNIRLLLDHSDINERPSFLVTPTDTDEDIARLSNTLTWLKHISPGRWSCFPGTSMTSNPDERLNAYYAEILAAEDEAFVAAGGKHVHGGSIWLLDPAKLREINQRHGISQDDPRDYSIASSLDEKGRIETAFRSLCHVRGWNGITPDSPEWDEYYKEKVRRDARIDDLDARHFGQPSEEGKGVNSPRMLWGHIHRTLSKLEALESVGISTKTFDVSEHAMMQYKPVEYFVDLMSKKNVPELETVYGLMHKLKLGWSPKPPYESLSFRETIDELRRIANGIQYVESRSDEIGASSEDRLKLCQLLAPESTSIDFDREASALGYQIRPQQRLKTQPDGPKPLAESDDDSSLKPKWHSETDDKLGDVSSEGESGPQFPKDDANTGERQENEPLVDFENVGTTSSEKRKQRANLRRQWILYRWDKRTQEKWSRVRGNKRPRVYATVVEFTERKLSRTRHEANTVGKQLKQAKKEAADDRHSRAVNAELRRRQSI